ncbi:hypothetical protein [Haloarchaeobius sp. FL176]|uniref:DUF7344 domain-containing protein n=1 Tax=Haloarchaeobius sp. FL176 TaxID=2967129 RepID=UPI002147E81B|nr:hypothetical protein [Haloarchaeobius sp. FL176]
MAMTVDEERPVDDGQRAPVARRQFLLSYLDESVTPVTIDELADAVVEWEMQQVPTRLAPPDRRDVREQLHEVDLPALAADGLVTYNEDEGLVGTYDGEPTPLDPDPEPSTQPEQQAPWCVVVAGLVVVAALLVLAVVGLGFPVAVASLTTAVLVLLTVFATSLLR